MLDAAVHTPARFGALLFAIAIAGLTGHFLDVPGPDTAWLLYAARETLHGAEYAEDIAEINPPLIVWIKVPVVALAAATGMAVVPLWRGLVVLLIVASLVLADRVLRFVPAGRPPSQRRLLILGFAIPLVLLPAWEFGQKEHLSILFVLPLLLLAGVRCEGTGVPRGLAVLSGAIGGMGIAFKPHFALVGLAVEAVVQFRARPPRPRLIRAENLAVLTIGLAYLGAVTLLAPAYWGFARTWAGLYHRFLHVDTLSSIALAPWSAFLVFAVAAILALGRLPTAEARPVDVLAAAAVGYYVAAIAQHKGGLEYRFLPAVVAAYGGLWWLLLVRHDVPTSRVRRLYFRLAVLSILVVPLLAVGRGIRRGSLENDPQYAGLSGAVTWVRENSEGRPVMVLSTHIGTAFPLVFLAGVKLATRHPHLWQLAALYHRELWESGAGSMVRTPRDRGVLERQMLGEVVEDFRRHDPALLILPPLTGEWGAAGSRRFDYLSYFGSDSSFARLFAGFQRHQAVGEYVFYTRVPIPLQNPGAPP